MPKEVVDILYTEKLELFCRVDLFVKQMEDQHNIENGSCMPESNMFIIIGNY